MSKYRRAARVDINQQEIVQALRSMGVSVITGMDDILAGYNGKTYWFEIKSANAVSKKTGEILESKKKSSQVKLEKEWRGHYAIVSCLEDILAGMGITRGAETP